VLESIRIATLRGSEEGMDLLHELQHNPGRMMPYDSVRDPDVQDTILEGGGVVWWCGGCDRLCFPNRPCDCGLS
jgi:hypothetical protein